MKLQDNFLRKSFDFRKLPSTVKYMSDQLGTRIRYYRELAGLQSGHLAETVGMSASAMSLVESGQRGVKAEELALIAEAIGISPLALLDPGSLTAELPVSARALEQIADSARILPKLTYFAEIYDLVNQFDNRPDRPNDAPTVQINGEWLESAKALADWSRQHLGTWQNQPDPFGALRDAIEQKLFIDVVVEEFGDEDLLGAAITSPRLPLLAVNASQRRQRAMFTLAHELGHVLSGDGQPLITDRDLSARTPSERFANAFAAELLLPTEQVHSFLDKSDEGLDALAHLLLEFGVSWQTLIYRLHNLQLVDASSRNALMGLGRGGLLQYVSNDLREKLQTQDSTRLTPSAPRWLSLATVRGYMQGVVSIRSVATLLDVDPDDLLRELQPPPISETDPTTLINLQFNAPLTESDEERFAGAPF